MALKAIGRQPISMEEIREKAYMCEDEPEYCALFKKGTDSFMVQMRQEPCGASLLCNPDFDYSASNLITNGHFTGSAAGWTLGANTTYGSNKITHNGAGSQTTQNVASLLAGQSHAVSITVTGYVSGNFFVQFVGGGVGPTISANGTYNFNIAAGITGTNTFDIVCGAGQFSIDDISMVTVTCWIYGDDWTFGSGRACHIPGGSSALYADIFSSLVADDYTVFTYEVFGMTAGTLDISVGGDLEREVTANGSYTDYFNSIYASTLLELVPSSDFDGCIKVTSFFKLLVNNDLSFTVVDIDGNVVDTFPGVSLNEDRVNGIYDTSQLSEGCYRIKATDDCITSALTFTEMNTDVGFDHIGNWDAIVNVNNGSLVLASSALIWGGASVAPGRSFISQAATYTPLQGHDYIITVKTFVQEWDTENAKLYLAVPTGATVTLVPLINTSVSTAATYTTTFFIHIDNPATSLLFGAYNMHNKFALVFDASTDATQYHEIRSCSIKIVAIAAGTQADYFYTSQCLSVLTDVGDAQLMQGVSDNAHSMGFVFGSGFTSLDQRIMTHFTNPHNPLPNSNYLYSNGIKKKAWGQVDKLWDTIFDSLDGIGLDQNAHDVIGTSMNMDHLYIGQGSADRQEYISAEKTYTPNYDKRTGSQRAEGVVELGRIDGTEFK